MMRSTLRTAARRRPLPGNWQLWQKDTAKPLPCQFMMAPVPTMQMQMPSHQLRFNHNTPKRDRNPNVNFDNLNNSGDANSDNDGTSHHIRLSKRMSELGICSRREAAAILKEASECRDESSLTHLTEVIYLRGKPVMGGAATKLPPDETFLEIRAGNDPPKEDEEATEFVPYCDRPWEDIKGDTIVLNKPIGYVSGQEEHQHVPAVRLLSRNNMQLDDFYFSHKEQDDFKKGTNTLHFDRWKFDGFDKMANSVPKKIRETFSDEQLNEKSRSTAETLSGYAPAGRLDIDSTGVILFTRRGIMARRLIEPKSNITKEYIVKVDPAVQPTAREVEMGLTKLPSPTRDLSILLRKTNKLWGEVKQLKPLIEAEWIDDEDVTDEQTTKQGSGNVNQQQQSRTMRLVLVEGKKRQIRRMCREILGWHVVELTRISVGPVHIDSLPEGKWRPLTQTEMKAIFEEQEPNTSAKPVLLSDTEKIARLIQENPELPKEKEVMKAVLEVLRDPRYGKSISSPMILKNVVQYLDDFDPKSSSRLNRKWKQYFGLVVINNRKK